MSGSSVAKGEIRGPADHGLSHGGDNDRSPRRRDLRGLVCAILVAGAIGLLGLPPAGSLAASDARVVDFHGSCNTATGCLRARPSTWLPDRIPREGVGLIFSGLRWSGWGAKSASASGLARICVQGDCSTSKVAFRAYQLRWVARPRVGRIYQCMRFTRSVPELLGAAIDISATGDFDTCS